MKGPVLSVDGIKFMMTGPFSDGYENTITPLVLPYSHPAEFFWSGGQFKMLTFVLDIVVDEVGTTVSTPRELVDIVEKLINKALPKSSTAVNMTALPEIAVNVSIGSWWARTGYIQDVTVEWRPPWDIDTGMPMAAQVRFSFLTDFVAREGDKKLEATLTKLPRQGSWKFGG